MLGVGAGEGRQSPTTHRAMKGCCEDDIHEAIVADRQAREAAVWRRYPRERAGRWKSAGRTLGVQFRAWPARKGWREEKAKALGRAARRRTEVAKWRESRAGMDSSAGPL